MEFKTHKAVECGDDILACFKKVIDGKRLSQSSLQIEKIERVGKNKLKITFWDEISTKPRFTKIMFFPEAIYMIGNVLAGHALSVFIHEVTFKEKKK
jgi:hypothetical protein